ncbi:sulfatase family protein [Nocardioides antri]|uniref:Sulfatase n=1 Tax=Nocardioides antri TaxID=2607659 RepID=A0A5B1LWW6_9ACTN|nr:sulfatase [Nocardioides antri]KAA1424239.1 sulfatase [Nocardioides antri]
MLSAIRGSLLCLLALAGAVIGLVAPGGDPSPAAQGAPYPSGVQRPNVVLILTDDMRADELRYLPHVRRLLVARGVTYTNAISPHPICCPARASLATGQLAQNNGVRHNEGPWGGYQSLLRPRNTVARWLHEAGYHNGFHGKYLNYYHQSGGRRPPGWDVWEPQLTSQYAYGLRPTRFEGGTRFSGTYITEAVQELTDRSIRRAHRSGKPFFEWINHVAPHAAKLPGRPHQIHPVYQRKYADAHAHALPRVIREGDFRGTAAERRWLIDHTRARLRALRSVDDAVARTVRLLRRTGELKHTYFVFTSDNGYQLGEQGILGKNRLYEGSLRVPLVVRGPGIAPGTRDDTPVSLVDLVPTFVTWAGATPGRRLDGLPIGAVDDTVRDTLLIQTGDQREDASPGWWWRGVRTRDYVYAAPVGRPDRGFLYDLESDPGQRTNLIRRQSHASIRVALARRTAVLSGCSGPAECNRVFGPLPPVG